MKKRTTGKGKAKAAAKPPRGGKKGAPGKKDAPGTVTIRDAGLRKGLEQALRKGAVKGMQVDRAALAEEHEIDWSEDQAEAFPDQWKSIRDLNGLEHATSLRKLSVWGNGISSLAPLAPLTELEEIWAFNNQIKTTAGLANKPKLRELHLNDNPIASIAELRGLPALEELALNDAKITDLSPLLDLPKLRKLDISRVEKARIPKNLQVLVALADRQVVIGMDSALQKAFEEQQAKALMKEPSADPVLERFRQLAQPALALLWKRAGAAAKDAEWNTLLHLVVDLDDAAFAKRGKADAVRVELIRQLVAAGVDVNAQNDDHGFHTALSLAVAKDRSLPVVQALLDAGASARLPRRKPVLAVAIEKRRPPAVIEKLIAAGADLTHPAVLAEAVKQGRRELIAPVLRSVDWRKQAHLRTPALTDAVEAGDDAMIDLLLDAGAPPNGGSVYRAVFYAKNVATLDKLIARGADPLVRKTYGTALHHLRTSSPEAPQMVDRLVDLGVPVDARDYACKTALAKLVEHGELPLAVGQRLVARGADPNARAFNYPEGWTVLDCCVPAGHDRARELGGVTTKVWVGRQLKVIAGAKELEGESMEALAQLAIAGQLENLGAEKARVTKQVNQVLKERKDDVSKALAPLGLHPLSILWIAHGVHGRNLREEGMLQIAVNMLVDTEQWEGERVNKVLRALCAQGAPVDITDHQGEGALAEYVKMAMRKFAPDPDLVRALIPKQAEQVTWALIEMLRFRDPLTKEWNAVLDLLIAGGADLTEPEAFALLCGSRRKDLVQRALDAGADPAWKDETSDLSALEEAFRADDVEVLELLLNAGAPPDLGWEGTGGPAFHEMRSVAAFELLRRHKLDTSLRRGYGKETLLDQAVKRLASGYPKPADPNNDAQFIKHLAASGFDLDAVDSEGKTPRARLQSAKDEAIRAAIAKAGLLT